MQTVRFFILTTALFFTCALFAPARAQNGSLGLTITPSVSIVPFSRTSSTTIAITFRSDSVSDLLVTPSIQPFHIEDETEDVVLDPPDTSHGITLQNSEFTFGKPFTLGAGESKQIVLSLPPQSASDHDLQYTILATTHPQPATLGSELTSASSSISIGAHLIFTSPQPPTLDQPLILTRVNIAQIIDTFDTLPFEASVHNQDHTLHQIKGTLQLHGPFTSRLLPFSQKFITAGSTRPLTLRQRENDSPSSPSLSGPFFPGRYTLTTTLLEDGANPVKHLATVYVLPIRVTIAIIGLSIFLLFMGSRLHKRKNHL